MSQPEAEEFEPYGHIIFCDDVREEVSGKITIVGVYGPDLVLFNSIPTTLAKLCFIVDFFQPHTSDLVLQSLEITQPGADYDDLLFELKFPEQMVSSQKEQPTDDDRSRRMIRIQFCHSPFSIRDKGRMRARLVHNKGFIKLGSIDVTVADQPDVKH